MTVYVSYELIDHTGHDSRPFENIQEVAHWIEEVSSAYFLSFYAWEDSIDYKTINSMFRAVFLDDWRKNLHG